MSVSEYDLGDRMAATQGTVALSGIQALLRILIDQQRVDAAAGLRTAGLISGYRGSPVGGVDQVFAADAPVFAAHDIKFINGVNEELGATAVWGSQQTALESTARFDGVMGMWYGKGPGVDRAGDALRHANSSGTHPNGGVLAVAGDDPFCKSSTIASASEWALADLAMPTLYPATVAEILDYGRYGYELSRFCGSWVGFKIHSNTADAYASVVTNLDRFSVIRPEFEVDGKPFAPFQTNTLISPVSMRSERDMFGPRLDAARLFVAANGLDRCFGAVDSPARLGIVAAGPVYGEIRDSLAEVGLGDDAAIAAAGIRLYKPAMIWPLEPTGATTFADGLEEIVVIEEKRSFIESQLRDMLYGRTGAPRVLGKHDDEGRPLVPHYDGLDSDKLTPVLRARIGRVCDVELRPERKLIPLTTTAAPATAAKNPADLPSRSAYFCSGCPHNRSTVLPDGSMSGGGIGCHGMALGMDRESFGITHMGGEGVQWVGMAPFVTDRHRFQNLGDGTFAHSGSLAIRQAISAGTNVTYKILYNGTVAMTGGQDAAGQMSVPDLTRMLEAEGVVRTVVVADDTDKYPADARFATNSRVEHRDRLDAVQRELREVVGTSVLIYDQQCAAELRRGRKRGTIETPTTRLMIDPAICEGCGHCGEVSNCASVHPVQTPFGRKTQIHQESCNFDLTCLGGNCPAFISVEIDPNDRPSRTGGTVSVPDGPDPSAPAIPEQANILLVGIGGTGVVTVNQILATAALLDGKHANALDQTGMAQKGGPVVSNLRITAATNGAEANPDITSSNRVGTGAADALLVFDLVTATKNLHRASPDRTKAVVSTTLIPTGAMVSGRGAERFPDLERYRSAIQAATVPGESTWIDATGIARQVFASQPAANVMVVGIAYQRGMLPVSAESIERAIELNGVAVQTNHQAFRLGRRIASDPELAASLSPAAKAEAGPPDMSAVAARMADKVGGAAGLREILAYRLDELIAYQDRRYAERYSDTVAKVRRAEARLEPGTGDEELTETVAKMLFKAMAYKDEYEIARLALAGGMADQARARFGPNAKVSYQLKPPTMQAAGLDRKVAIPEAAATKMFAGLAKTKRLRGTRLDPFGRTRERRIERELIDEYEDLVDRLVAGLNSANRAEAIAIAGLFDMVRGFDEIKLANVAEYRRQVGDRLAAFAG